MTSRKFYALFLNHLYLVHLPLDCPEFLRISTGFLKLFLCDPSYRNASLSANFNRTNNQPGMPWRLSR